MKNLNELENLVKLDPTYLTVRGDQLALEDRKTGKVYITTKPNINKLFDDMGYRSLNVVNILKEFAGKVISDVGSLKAVNVYADEIEGTCVITTPAAIQWTADLSEFLSGNGFTFIQTNSYDSCRSLDEYVVKSPNGTYFAIDIDLVYEEAKLYSMNDISTAVKIMPESTFNLAEASGIDDIKATLLSNIKLTSVFTENAPLSVAEYIDFLSILGIVKKGRKAWSITELGEEEILSGLIPKIDQNIEAINELSWIKSHIVESGVTLADISQLLTYKLDTVFIYKFADFYLKNYKESSDYFLSK